MSQPETSEILITADAHVGETEALRERMPAEFRESVPRLGIGPNGELTVEIKGQTTVLQAAHNATPADLEREFRSDPSLGTDLDVRRMHMLRENVDAQVIFPNLGISCGLGHEPQACYEAWAHAHNDYVRDVFGSDPERFRPAAMLHVEDVDVAVAEATRCIENGFCTLFIPAVMPWQPYRLGVYEPLWSLAEEAGIPLSFHIFSGNLALGGEFGAIARIDSKRYERARVAVREEGERLEELSTVVGMAAGIAPIVELTGSGVLERHPGLRFVVTESDCGWLAWTLQAMDQMQQRRSLGMRKLPMRASDYFRRQGAVTIGDDPVGLNNLEFTGADCLLWGNDYPHDEGTWPNSDLSLAQIRKRLSPGDAHKVLCGNAARLYGFDLDYLASHQAEYRRAAAA